MNIIEIFPKTYVIEFQISDNPNEVSIDDPNEPNEEKPNEEITDDQ